MEQNSSETDSYSTSQEMYPASQKKKKYIYIFNVVKSTHFNSVFRQFNSL